MLYSGVSAALAEILEMESKFGSYISAVEEDRVTVIKTLNYLFKTGRIANNTKYRFDGLLARVFEDFGPDEPKQLLAIVQCAKTQYGYFISVQFADFEPTVEYVDNDVFNSVLKED